MRNSEKAKFAFRGVRMLILASITLLAAVSAFGQATTGSLKGLVVDANGAVVANAAVVVKNEGTGSEITTNTGGDGVFEAPNLQPGAYTVTVEVTGFKRSVTKNVSVKVGIINPVDIKLEAGNVAESVTVTASTEEIVQRDQSQISATIETRKIADLPSNGAGGGIDTLALLVPGVVANRGGGTNTNGTGLSVNGNRGRTNNFQIDGSDNNDLSVAGPALFVDFQDQVQEFQVITNNFSAQYGRNQGAVINIVTKGGTNEFHGTLFEFHRDNFRLNSLNNIERATGQLQPSRSLYNAFGGTVGGPVYLPIPGEGNDPIWKGTNKLFFFFGYQGIRNPASFISRTTALALFPTDFARFQATYPGNGVANTIANFGAFAIPGAVTNNQTAGTPVPTAFNFGTLPAGCTTRAIPVGGTAPAACAGVAYTAFVNPATGQPFITGGAFDVFNFGTAAAPVLFQFAQPQRTAPVGYTENYYSYRFDARPTNKDTINYHFLNQKGVSQNGIGTISAGITGDIPASSRNVGGNWVRQISNRFVNEFRISYNRIGVEFGGGCTTGEPSCIPGPADIGLALANVSFGFGGVTKPSSPIQTLGPATNLPQGRIGKVYQFADNFSMVFGRHSITVGAEYKHLNTIVPFLPNYNGTFSYNVADRVVNNAPSGVSITLGDPTLAFKENDQYYFFQDDFKVRPNLTLNLGVRYEYTGQPMNLLHEVTVARESGPNPFFNPALPLSIRTVPHIPPDKNNFAPRFGFAWSPKVENGFLRTLLGNDETVIRGGFSIAYDLAYYNILLNVQNAAPFSVALAVPVSSLPATGSPAPLPPNPTGDVVRAAAEAAGILPTGVLNPTYLAQTNVAPDFHAPYSEQFSLGVQRQLGRNNIVEARYVGTHGVSLFQNLNGNFYIRPLVNGFTLTRNGLTRTMPSFANLLPPGTTAQTCVDVAGTLDLENACDGRQFRQAGVTTRANTAQSIYHSLQTRYNGRFLNNTMNLGMSYTWSKTIDDASEIFAFGDVQSPNAQNPFCINRCERALSALDRPHAFSANFIYDLPWYKEQRGVVGHLLGGWQINGTYVVTTGSPFTPGQSGNGSLGLGNTYLTAGDRPFLGNPSADERLVAINAVDARWLFATAPLPAAPAAGSLVGPGDNVFYLLNDINAGRGFNPVNLNQVRYIFNGPGAARFFGTPFGDSTRNRERGPMLNQMNLSVFKNIKIGESVTFQLRGEAFNALNHPNPGFGTGQGGYLPSININNAGVSGASFNTFTDITYARRVLQFGARLIF
jgi:outer membrane receptor protein involved in Fe transport